VAEKRVGFQAEKGSKEALLFEKRSKNFCDLGTRIATLTL
jgi:hypothetical protein